MLNELPFLDNKTVKIRLLAVPSPSLHVRTNMLIHWVVEISLCHMRKDKGACE